MKTYELLKLQHEYSKFVTMRDFVNLSSDDDFEYCMNILECVPNIDLEIAKHDILTLMGFDYKSEMFTNNDWDYIMLDEILKKHIKEDLYWEYEV